MITYNPQPYKISQYHPHPRTAQILNWCLQTIQSVVYEVTLRWIFYRAMQKYSLGKEDYPKFKNWLSCARKSFWNGWTPYTLADDTRYIVYNGLGYDTVEDWLHAMKEQKCKLDKYALQDNLVIICFEAHAMYAQFEHYTKPYHVCLVPFGGDPSIPHKWKVAQLIRHLHDKYDRPIAVLYFGDRDDKGEKIEKSAYRDIKQWTNVDFEWKRVGLTKEQAVLYNIPENFEKPSQYQWEALDDAAANELIISALNTYVDLTAIESVREEEEKATERWQDWIYRSFGGTEE